MEGMKDLIWDTLYDIPRKGPSYLGPREYFNEYGAWMGSLPFGYDFICDANNDCGYIHYWTDITGDAEFEDKEFLFGRSSYLAIITVNSEQENDLVDFLFNENVPITLLGHVTKGELRLDDLSFGYIEDYIEE